MSDADYYHFVGCPAPDCRLRFPGVAPVACPLCKTPTVQVADRAAAPQAEPALPTQALDMLVDNVRSVFNVGSIFRSADGCGVKQLYLCGITPTPEHPAMKKTALGAEQTLAWSTHKNGVHLAQSLKAQGHVLWALERTQGSIDLFGCAASRPADKLVLVVGNEVAGVDPGILEVCERSVHIPMRGKKSSLNVATAMGIAAYALCRVRP